MTRRLGIVLAATALAAASVGLATPLGADEGGPSAQALIATLTGGGPGSGSQWFVVDSSTLACASSIASTGGLGVNDATLDPSGLDQSDAYDGAFLGYVNGIQFPGSPNSTDGSTFVQGGPALVGGVTVTVRFTVIPGSHAGLREVVTFTNPGVTTANVTWTQAYNLGSDASTRVLATGSGDTTLSTTDSYSVTSDGNTSGGGDPVNTLVYFGNGNVLHPTFGGTCANTFNGNDSLALDYALSIPAGGTVRLMFFGVLSDSTNPAVATAEAPVLPAITAGSPLLAGLTAAELASIKNWNFPMTVAVVATPMLTG